MPCSDPLAAVIAVIMKELRDLKRSLLPLPAIGAAKDAIDAWYAAYEQADADLVGHTLSSLVPPAPGAPLSPIPAPPSMDPNALGISQLYLTLRRLFRDAFDSQIVADDLALCQTLASCGTISPVGPVVVMIPVPGISLSPVATAMSNLLSELRSKLRGEIPLPLPGVNPLAFVEAFSLADICATSGLLSKTRASAGAGPLGV